MGFALSMLLVTAGAVVRFALTRTTWGDWNLHALGVIAMVVGTLGLVASTIRRIPRRRRRRHAEESVGEHAHAHG